MHFYSGPPMQFVSGVDTHTYKSANQADPKVRRSTISALAILSGADGAVLASAGWEDKTVKVWNWTTMRSKGIIPRTGYIMRLGSGMIESQLALISLNMDLRCKVWEPETGRLLKEYIDERIPDTTAPYESESLWYVDMAVGRVGARNVVAIAARDGTLTIIDLDSLAVIAAVSIGYGAWGQSIALAHSGTIAVAGARGITAIKVCPERAQH
jgi:WD40 repeat protein